MTGAGALVTRSVIGARCELISGVRVWPGVELPPGAVRFSAEG
ncbi:MAG TPA: hypothetical protein VIJ00_04505 [Nakamurella sp.]